MSKSLRKNYHHLDRRLRLRLRIYFVISFVLACIFVFNIGSGSLRPDLGILGMIAGIGIGFLTARMFNTKWDENARKVVSRLDFYGVIILVLYVIFELLRSQIVGYFTNDYQVGTVGFAVLAGIMFGRLIGTRGKILKVLEEQKVFSA